MDWIKRILCVSVLLCSLSICAENTYNCVVLETIEGQIIEFGLLSNPCLIQKNDTIIMTNNEKKVEVVMTDVKKIYFSSTNNGIKRVVGTAKGQLKLQQECMCLSNFSPGEYVTIYNLSGQQIMKRVISSQGTLVIPFSDIPKGIIIIKSNQQSFKLIRK